MDRGAGRLILLTGATGFVGGRLWPLLTKAGYRVRGLSRSPARGPRHGDSEWFQGDVASESDLRRALEGAKAAYYLVHGMGDRSPDFRRREVKGAETFARAAQASGVERIVYLGGVAPTAEASEHLKSRLEVGEVLRGGSVPAIELRASMIIGNGSLSWLIVRDLAARLPVMVLPRWLESRTEPVGIDDVGVALVRALSLPITQGIAFSIPGPEVLTGREVLERTAVLLGRRKPLMIAVPFLTPRLSSHWVRFVTRADWSIAREVVVGMTGDLLAPDRRYWDLIEHPRRQTFEEAASRALREERLSVRVPGAWGLVERWLDAHATG